MDEKEPALTQGFPIDAVADTRREVPLAGHLGRRERLRRQEQGVDRNHVVLVAVNEQDRRLGRHLAPEAVRPLSLLQHDHAREADDRGRRPSPSQSDMEGHHRALAEPDESQPGCRKIEARELCLEEAVETGPGRVDAAPALVGIPEGEGEPFPPAGRRAAGLRCVRRHEGGVRQPGLPLAADLDEIVAVGAVAVEEHDELARPAGGRGETGSCELSQATLLLWPRRPRPVATVSLSAARKSGMVAARPFNANPFAEVPA